MPDSDLIVCEEQRQEPRLAIACRHFSCLAEFELQYGIIQTQIKMPNMNMCPAQICDNFVNIIEEGGPFIRCSLAISRSHVDKIPLGAAMFITNLGRILTQHLASVSVLL
jgi:hypothetical protein